MANVMPTLVVPETAQVPAGAPTAGEWTQTKGRADRLAAKRYDPTDPAYGAIRDSPTAAAANTAAINACAEDARLNDGILDLRGTFHIAGTVTLRCHVDGTSGTLRIADTAANPAVLVGSRTSGVRLDNRTIALPAVIQGAKTAPGWTGASVGVEVSNANSCTIFFQMVSGFTTNIRLTATGQGNAYNTYHLGLSHNGQVGLELAPLTGGWVNENVFIGGRFAIDSAEGTNVAGTSHVRVTANGTFPANNNRFLGTSLEGNGPEFHVDLTNAFDNRFLHCRWEASPPKVRLNNAPGTFIDGGYGADSITFTHVGAQQPLSWIGRVRRWLRGTGAGGVLVIENAGSGAYPAIVVLDTGAGLGADPATAYTTAITAQMLKFKRAADAFDRLQMDAQNSRVNFGGGAAATDAYLRRFGTGGLEVGGYLYATKEIHPSGVTAAIYGGAGSPEGVVAAPAGSLYLNTSGGAGTSLWVKQSGAGNTGWVGK